MSVTQDTKYDCSLEDKETVDEAGETDWPQPCALWLVGNWMLSLSPGVCKQHLPPLCCVLERSLWPSGPEVPVSLLSTEGSEARALLRAGAVTQARDEVAWARAVAMTRGPVPATC